MNTTKNVFPVLFVCILVALCYPSCKHEPFIDGSPDPTDTLPTDTVPVDTTPVEIPCSPDSVYFENEILPMLVSNCTESGCHNAIDRQDGVILDSYANIIGTVDGVTSNDWNENELIEVLVLNDPSERMPPAPNDKLTLAQVERITKWIAQGAKNNGCNEQTGGACDTLGLTYTNFIKPLVQAKCQGCHGGTNPSAGINLSAYASTKPVALNGKLVASITRASNWMPKNGQKLDNCTINKVKAWVNAGAPE
jgi:hypothetical protein